MILIPDAHSVRIWMDLFWEMNIIQLAGMNAIQTGESASMASIKADAVRWPVLPQRQDEHSPWDYF